MYSLNLAEDKRILSVSVCLQGFEYDNIVDTLPEGDVTDYKYIDGEYVHEPLPQPEEEEGSPTIEDAVAQNAADIAFLAMMLDVEM